MRIGHCPTRPLYHDKIRSFDHLLQKCPSIKKYETCRKIITDFCFRIFHTKYNIWIYYHKKIAQNCDAVIKLSYLLRSICKAMNLIILQYEVFNPTRTLIWVWIFFFFFKEMANSNCMWGVSWVQPQTLLGDNFITWSGVWRANSSTQAYKMVTVALWDIIQATIEIYLNDKLLKDITKPLCKYSTRKLLF